jgi:radical SAM superfamily enzyme YgiQ (UPF0313 family)
MMAQREDFHHLIRKAVAMGKNVAVGGPYPGSPPEHALRSVSDYLILVEGEITVPQFLVALEQGVFRTAEKPDVTLSPLPRYDC